MELANNNVTACFTMLRIIIIRVYFDMLSRTVSILLSWLGSSVYNLIKVVR